MKMCDTDHINWMETPSLLPDTHLCSLTAVDQQAASIVSRHQRSQCPVWKRHHTASSKQTYVQHKSYQAPGQFVCLIIRGTDTKCVCISSSLLFSFRQVAPPGHPHDLWYAALYEYGSVHRRFFFLVFHRDKKTFCKFVIT